MIGSVAVAVMIAATGGGGAQDIAEQAAQSVPQVLVFNGSGSGFIVADGFVVTNAHVVDGASDAELAFEDGLRSSCQVTDRNAVSDLALLRCDTTGRAAVTLAETPPSLGAEVVVAGFPGEDPSAFGSESLAITSGVVSRVSNSDGYLQTDAALNPGNSGGPVFLAETGEVVGVATAVRTDQENSGFAVPIDTLRSFLAAGIGAVPDGQAPSPDSASPALPPVDLPGAGGADDSGTNWSLVLSIGAVLVVAGWAGHQAWSRRSRPVGAPRPLNEATPSRRPRPDADIEIILVGEAKQTRAHDSDQPS
jgi:S1-C subfamily serine protease